MTATAPTDHHLTPLKTHLRRFRIVEGGAEIVNVHKTTGVIHYDLYTITRLPDVNGVAVYEIEQPKVVKYRVTIGQYPSCGCEANTRQRGVYCKHIVMVERYAIETNQPPAQAELDRQIDEDRGMWQADQAEQDDHKQHDFSRAEGEW